jgi:hypothetical protein
MEIVRTIKRKTREDEHWIHEHDQRQHGALRKGFQPDMLNPFTLNPFSTRYFPKPVAKLTSPDAHGSYATPST